MKNLFTLIFIISSVQLFAQNYWQQEVNYKIDVTLDDVKHEITAFEEFEYINHSPNKLDFLYIHLWPNAYQNEKTALGQQLWKNGEQLLKFGNDSVKGNISGLDFKINGVPVKWEFDPINPDICKLNLNESLISGGKIIVSTPFKVKIPDGSISRLGHVGQSYQITQWYPKPAVYDKNGWNPIPYLNQGEFYSEYGSFDVSITLPKNYVVGATGDLQTDSEIQFLDDLANETLKNLKNEEKNTVKFAKSSPFPTSSTEMKTIRYKQTKVHDFAWFADKRYMVLKGEVELPQSKRKVTTWAMFTPRNKKVWENAIEYINDGTYYYSLWNGDYPYNQVTAVDGTISAGGGMEYPNVTVIGNTGSKEELEVVIVHEVGHNWFYGILGSNERVHGWMDEGMNTLNEVRYIQHKYPNNTRFSDMVLNGKFHMDHLSHHDLSDISYRFTAIMGEDQPIETHSADFTSVNYGSIMYMKTGLVMFYLKDYLGEELFGKCALDYFEAWKFKHPQPEDMRASFEKSSGKNLSWLFDDLIQTTNHIDYKIVSVKKEENGTTVKVKNKGQVNGPISVSVYSEGKLLETKWAEPGDDIRQLTFSAINIDEVKIDADKNIPEMSRRDNTWAKARILNKMEPLKFEFLIGDHETSKTNVFWTPMIGGNVYDKTMLGLAVHNLGVPFKKFQYIVAPMYATGRKSVSGMAEFSYSFLPKTKVKLTKVGLSVKSFGDWSNSSYLNLSPYLSLKIGNRKKATPFSQFLLIQGCHTERFSEDKFSFVKEAGGFIKYNLNYDKPDFVVNATLRNDYLRDIDFEEDFARASVEGTFKYRYLKNKMKRWVEMRLFFGKMYLSNFSAINYRYAYSLAGSSGAQDIFYEEYFFGRNETFGTWGQQRVENMGGFKSVDGYGTTNNWLTSANLYLQLPIPSGLIGVFADAGAFSNNGVVYGAFNTGLGLRISNVFGVYFPLYQSQNESTLFTNYKAKIRFSLKMNLVNKGLKFKLN